MKYPNGNPTRKKQNTDRQLSGKRSQESGAMFEKLIDQACIYYADNKEIALIEKTPEPMRLASNKKENGKFSASFTKKAQPDYKGTLRGGKAIIFEAKHTDENKIKQCRVTKWQIDLLERHHRLGAKCGVLVSIKMQDFYFVPWCVWKNMKSLYGRVSMTSRELERFRVPFSGGIIKFLEWTNGGSVCT